MKPSSIQTAELNRSRRLWVLFVLFFFQYAAIGAYYAYLSIFYSKAGMSGVQIGIINMIASLVSVIGMTVWGYLSDRTGTPRLVIAATAAATLVVALLVQNFHTFGAFVVLGAFAGLFSSGPSTLNDSTALSLLGDRREDYGRYRLGGSVGYIITAMLAGVVYNRLGTSTIFPAYAILMGIQAGVALLLPPSPVHPETRSLSAVTLMMKKPAWVLFTIMVFACWIGINSVNSYLGVSLTSIGADQVLVGTVFMISAVIETPFMLFSGAIMRRFGPVKLLIVGLAILTLRFTLLGLMQAPAWAILFNGIAGPGFVLFWNSALNYANRMAPPAMAGTVQGILSSTTSLAGMVSSLLSGWLLDTLGPTQMYLVIAAISALGLVIFVIGTFSLRRPAVEQTV